MKKKIGKGKLITELVKGSLEYTRDWIVQQFRRQFPYTDGGPNYYIIDSFADHVVVESYSSPELMPSEFYRVPFTKSGETYTFAPRDQWEIVELTYQPAVRASDLVAAESKKQKVENKMSNKGKGKKMQEFFEATMMLEEKREGKPRRIKFEGAMRADVVNGNIRRYTDPAITGAFQEVIGHLHESAGQGRVVQLLGEGDHPSDKGTRPLLSNTVMKWDELSYENKRMDVAGNIVETSAGKDIIALLDGGVKFGVSVRGYGEGKYVTENKQKIFEVSEFHITGFDLVADPSFENSVAIIESQNQSSMEDDMNELLEQLKKLFAEHPEVFNNGMTEAKLAEMNEAALKKLDESIRKKLGIDADVDIAKALEETVKDAAAYKKLMAQNAINEAKAEATKDLPFGEKLNKLFVEAVNAAELETPDAVKKFAESKRKEYSALAAAGVLKGMGFVEGKVIGVKGPVLELETGTPEFASGAFQLTESVRKRENRSKSAIIERADSPAAVFTKLLLERFDEMYAKKLMAESQLLQEAEQTSDLNLPYSVSRAIIEEAFPNLVAANIFDVGVIGTSPTRLYYEETTGESGSTVTITDEVVTGGAEDVWYALDHGRVVPGTVVVTSNPAGTTYVEGTDYVINYADGKIKFLEPGSIGSNDVLVDYQAFEMRGGEMDPIERVKTSLSYKTIEAAADRLADQISSEAIVFSRSQLGWDAIRACCIWLSARSSLLRTTAPIPGQWAPRNRIMRTCIAYWVKPR